MITYEETRRPAAEIWARTWQNRFSKSEGSSYLEEAMLILRGTPQTRARPGNPTCWKPFLRPDLQRLVFHLNEGPRIEKWTLRLQLRVWWVVWLWRYDAWIRNALRKGLWPLLPARLISFLHAKLSTYIIYILIDSIVSSLFVHSYVSVQDSLFYAIVASTWLSIERDRSFLVKQQAHHLPRCLYGRPTYLYTVFTFWRTNRSSQLTQSSSSAQSFSNIARAMTSQLCRLINQSTIPSEIIISLCKRWADK